jgi:hypothetical protein
MFNGAAFAAPLRNLSHGAHLGELAVT